MHFVNKGCKAMAPFASLLQYRTIRPYVRFAHIVDAPMAVTNRYIYDHEMIFILEGEGTIVTDSGESAYGQHSLLLIPPGVVHSFRDRERFGHAHLAIHFDWEHKQMTSTSLLAFSDKAGKPADARPSIWLPHMMLFTAVPAGMLEAAKRVVSAYAARSTYHMLELQAAFLQLAFLLVNGMASKELAGRDISGHPGRDPGQHKSRRDLAELIERLRHAVEAPIVEPTAVKELSESAHFCDAHFRRLFKEQVGYSPHQYFSMLRMNKAARLLLETALPVKDVAYACGYEDPKYFSRMFRQVEGMTPLEYRDSLKRT